MKCLIFFLSILLFHCSLLEAQTIPVGMPVLDEALRNLQLEGKLDLKYSLSSRPFLTDNTLTTDSIYKLIDPTSNIHSIRKHFFKEKGVFEVLPVTFESQYNSHHPYGWNHAGMIDAKGFQGLVSTGFYSSLGPLSIQFKPEFVYANNPNFEYSSQYGAPTKGPYKHAFAGQSSIRLNAKGISFGISTENMWWGPGIENSLLMSNNAPGFLHLTLNTTRPIKTPIGNFEFQLISGKLTEDTSVLLENKDLTTYYYTQGDYAGRPSNPNLDSLNWRYLNAITIYYNPKWIRGLFLGFNRLAYTYHNFIGEHDGFIHNYLPVFVGLFRSSNTYTNGSQHLKQIISISGRYLFQKSNAEIYAEYGWNDNTQNLRDLLMSPNHSQAFTFGLKKMVQISKNKWLDFSAEVTHLSQSVDNSIREAGYWYLYQGGYINQGRIIGTGIGLGSNINTLKFTIDEPFSKKGFVFQRLLHDPSPFYSDLNSPPIIDSRKNKWQDISIGILFDKKINKRVQLSTLIQSIYSVNYAWIKNDNKLNLHANITLVYFP